MPNASPRPSQLPEDIGMHVDELRKACPGIEQVWLLRHRTEPHPEWDLLVFADPRALDALRDARLQRPDVRILVVVDGDRFEAASGAPWSGRLSEIGWRLDGADSATYDGGRLAGREPQTPGGGVAQRSGGGEASRKPSAGNARRTAVRVR